jgi:hypothetical protein
MKVRIEESDFVVTMEHIGSESNYCFGNYTPEIRTLIEDYIVPCLVAVGFHQDSIYGAMEEITYDRKAEEVQDMPTIIPADEYPEYRMLSSMCGREGSAGQDKGNPEAEA